MARRPLRAGEIVKDVSDHRLLGRVLKVEIKPSVQGRGITEEVYVDWMVPDVRPLD